MPAREYLVPVLKKPNSYESNPITRDWLDFSKTSQRTRSWRNKVEEGGFSLLAENELTHESRFLSVGKIVRYKLRSSNDFVRGRINGITDSTITFHNKKGESVTFLHKEIAAFAVPRSLGRKIAGTLPLACGTTSIFIGLMVLSQGAGAIIIFIVPGLIGLANAATLISTKRVSICKNHGQSRPYGSRIRSTPK